MEPPLEIYCFKCRYASCQTSRDGTAFYWCSKHRKDLGSSILSVKGCEDFEAED